MVPAKSNLLSRRPSNYSESSAVQPKGRTRVVSRDHRRNRSSRMQRGLDRSRAHLAAKAGALKRLITPPIHVRRVSNGTPVDSPLPTIQEVPVELLLPSNQRVKLPAKLPRINVNKPISPENLASVSPQLADTPVPYLRDVFERIGASMEVACKSVKLQDVTPAEMASLTRIEMTLYNTDNIPPTHVLAVSKSLDASSAGSTFRDDAVNLYPVHSVIPTIYCSNLPLIRANNVESPSAPGEKVQVPLLRIQLPFPEEFDALLHYMYTRNPMHLMGRYVPSIKPEVVRAASATGTRQGQVGVYAYELTQQLSWVRILKKAMTLNGFAKNVYALGVYDKGMWGVMDICWEILTTALKISVQQARQPQSQRQ